MKKIDYQPKQVRIFLTLLFIFAVLLTFRLSRGQPPGRRSLFWALEALSVAVFLVLPKVFFPVFRIIMIVAQAIGNFAFLVISAITFYFVLTPLALVMRLFGKKFLEHKVDPSLSTYYQEGMNEHDIERQF
jgi:hypothetical protein